MIKNLKEVTKFLLISTPSSLEKVLFMNLLVKDSKDRKDHLVSVVQRLDNAIQWISVDKTNNAIHCIVI